MYIKAFPFIKSWADEHLKATLATSALFSLLFISQYFSDQDILTLLDTSRKVLPAVHPAPDTSWTAYQPVPVVKARLPEKASSAGQANLPLVTLTSRFTFPVTDLASR